uniref:Uncharacterized protein n=1 Tax=Arundo donax TaxID=35708 RepID=A0A0A8Y1N7_ARUDO
MNCSAVMLRYRGGEGWLVVASITIGLYTLVAAALPRGRKKQATETRGCPAAVTASTLCSTLLNLSLDMS